MRSRQDMSNQIRSARVTLEMRQKYADQIHDATLDLEQALREVADELGMPGLMNALKGRHIAEGRKLTKNSARLIAEIETAIAQGLSPLQIKGKLITDDLGV